MGKSLARLGVDVRPEERRLTLLLAASLFLVIAFQYIAKSIRQATFVDTYGATSLPWVYLLVAVCSYPVLELYVRSTGRLSRQTLIASTQIAVALATAVFWWLYGQAFSWVPVLFYVWAAIVFVVLVSQFWSFATDVLDARQAKRLFGLVGAGGLLGGIAGGQIARLATGFVGTRNTLLVAAGLMVTGAVIAFRFPRQGAFSDHPESPTSQRQKTDLSGGGLALLLRSPHLRLISLILLLSVVVAQIVDLQFNWAVEQSTSSLGDRTARFGNFLSVVSLMALVVQVFFTSRVHSLLGVGVAMRILPATIAAGTLAMLFCAGFAPELIIAAVLALKVGEGGVRYSIDQATRELLFFPVPSAVRMKAKGYIDVVLLRSAEGVAALILLPVSFGLIDPVETGFISLVLVGLWLVVAGATYRTYVGSFRDSLKDRTLDDVVSINLADVRTVELLVHSLGSADTRQVLHSLDILDKNGRGHLVPPLLLYHDDAEVRRRTLQVLASADRRDASSLVERRLGDDNPEVRAEAIRVLTEFNVVDACALMLPRLKEVDPKVRAAAVVCLINNGGESMKDQARLAIRDMLLDARPESRAEAVKAIGAIQGTEFVSSMLQGLDDPDAGVAREALHAVRRVIERDGFNPLYLPRLVSLLSDRRLKLDAREALVSFGNDAIPILAHFLGDREESIFVRRALPKTLARIGGSQAACALVASLTEAEDGFLRAQIIEALAIVRDEVHRSGASGQLERAVETETRRYLGRLVELVTIGRLTRSQLDGPLARCDWRGQNLLAQMLAERMEEHLENLFGLLALLYQPQDVWAAYRSLLSDVRRLRTNSLEYLENTLSGPLRHNVFAVIGDLPIEQKLRMAARDFGIDVAPLADTLRRLLDEGQNGDADARALSVAALYAVHVEELSDLHPWVSELLASTRDPLVRETASWVAGHLEQASPHPPSRYGV
ncbi:MAG TPA: Npt1/Npt2 family nucleotide transporter [Vicinamibacteria bacterium]|nr:Npt1/Npt2 family nucleotide transporter [Vicinamibacteria bacterium]